ncbi:MAG: hypothetical protein K5633_07105 [Paludibacteraceae bacterium]|nr:hypothetical protein [Paludibacteraceae bacterium]
MPITFPQAQNVIQRHFNTPDLVFNSHEFIEKYRLMYEEDYIQMLTDNQPGNPNRSIQETHKRIGAFLRQNENDLSIQYLLRIKDRNDHGEFTPVALWRKL